jgi:hypothetical protein
MKRCIVLVCLAIFFYPISAQNAEEAQNNPRMDLALYASSKGEMCFNFIPQWQFPFLQGDSPLTWGNNISLKLDSIFVPMWVGVTGDAMLTVAPFLSFTLGAQIGTGWNYDLFGSVQFVGLGLNRKTSITGSEEGGVIDSGLDGVVWDTHAGFTVQFDFAVLFPGDWNHVVVRIYNDVQYLAYTKASGDDLWYYYRNDHGLNRNAFNHRFTCFVGYAMPIFLDLAGLQFEGNLPFYNTEVGTAVSDIGYTFDLSLITNFTINKHFSIMGIVGFTNKLASPVTDAYKRTWGFDRVRLIATWHIR